MLDTEFGITSKTAWVANIKYLNISTLWSIHQHIGYTQSECYVCIKIAATYTLSVHNSQDGMAEQQCVCGSRSKAKTLRCHSASSMHKVASAQTHLDNVHGHKLFHRTILCITNSNQSQGNRIHPFLLFWHCYQATVIRKTENNI